MGKKINTGIFKDLGNNKHGCVYGYNYVDYINAKTKVKIECDKHGVFEQLPSEHLRNFYHQLVFILKIKHYLKLIMVGIGFSIVG